MAIAWKPSRKIEDLIAEEEARIDALKMNEQLKVWSEPVEEETPWRPLETLVETEPESRGTLPNLSMLTWTPPENKAELASPSPPVMTEPKPDIEWWEQPKAWAETAMGAAGETISKVPILPDILEKVAPVFEFIHEKLEKPWASIITAPWSPALPWVRGESWIDHQKREYEAWKAPTYVKGLAEFAMPLWWLPWLGWGAKGAKALGTGNKVQRALATLPKAGKARLPSTQILNDTLYKPDFFKRVALWSEDKPLISGIVKTLGGPSAFVKPPIEGELPLQIVKRAIVNRAVVGDMRHSIRGLLMPKLQRHGNPTKVLDIAEDGLIRSVKVADGSSAYLYDVAEGYIRNPKNYKFATKEAKAYMDDVGDVLKEVYELAAEEGVRREGVITVHRIVKGKTGTRGFEESEFGSLFEVARHHNMMADGVKAGVKYGVDLNESVASTISYYVRKVATTRFSNEIKPLGKTAAERLALFEPEFMEKFASTATRLNSAKHALQAVTRFKSFKGVSIPSATRAKIRNGLPEIAERIDDLMIIAPQNVDKVLGSMGREIWRHTKIKPKEFKTLVPSFVRGNVIKMSDLDDIVRQLNVPNRVAVKAITGAYRQAYRLNKQVVDEGIRGIQSELRVLEKGLAGELNPLRSYHNRQVRYYSRPRLGEFEGVFHSHPAFRGRVFDKEVVGAAEKVLTDRGTDWARNMAGVAGISRMLVAALDFSAPFIQGLSVLGRNPKAWLTGVRRQFEFFIKPENMYKYMADPANMALRAERVAAGGSSATFEFFEAMGPLQRGLEKIPLVGRYAKAGVGQTYGRAEAAFTGFGEVARNEMWKALRRPNMTEQQLMEVARTVDRMTGVMSMEALGIGATQRDLEAGFVFFAPRYTRASLSFVSDVFKGGITGANARQALGGIIGGGFAMYYGACSALGQQPNLDPRSGKFMTIKVGDEHIGIGGIMYGLIRFGSNLATTIAEEPIDLVRLNRFDNPFIKFMYQRTSPLTGLGVGLAVEHKNYFGEPFESPADYAKFLADKVIPIAMQRAMPWEEHKITAPVFASEILGARTFPKSAWELQEEAKQRLARENFGTSYENLDDLNRGRIDKMPEVEMFQEEIDVSTVHRGDALSVAFLQRRRERDDARFMYEDAVHSYQKAIDAGVITPYEFRELVSDAGRGLGATYEHIDSLPRYSEVIKKLDEPADITDEYKRDIAYDEFMETLYSGKLEDQYGIFQWEKYNQFIEEFRGVYGDDIYNYVLERRRERNADMPPLFQELEYAKELLQPVWEVTDRVIRLYGKRFAESVPGQSLISRLKKAIRVSSPEINRYYQLFYQKS